MKQRGILSKRQAELLVCQANGYSIKEAAHIIGCRVRTLDHHSLMIKRKLGVTTHAHAVAIAIFLGILEAEVEGAETEQA